MEFPGIVKEFNMEIDINCYLEKTVELYAHFINNDNKYQLSFLYKVMQLKDSNEKEK
jgi:hypothetical protein